MIQAGPKLTTKDARVDCGPSESIDVRDGDSSALRMLCSGSPLDPYEESGKSQHLRKADRLFTSEQCLTYVCSVETETNYQNLSYPVLVEVDLVKARPGVGHW